MTTPETDKAHALALLSAWINQRPGFDPANYDAAGYRADCRTVARDAREARTLLRAVELRGISADALRDASKHAFSGRLTLTADGIDYCTGQYWPTEYRAAACAVLASALWNYWRDDIPESVENRGQYLRDKAKREFGRALASRWFR